jgi:hypothetical protein
MRRRRVGILVLLPALLFVLTAPSASASVVRTPYSAFVFPAGWPTSGTTCPGLWITSPVQTCVVAPGTINQPDHGRWTIRDMATFSIVLSTSAHPSGYQLNTMSANLDAAGNGPAWGTFTSYTFGDEPLFSGTWQGTFESSHLGGTFVGRGLGANIGLHITGDILVADTALGNEIGVITQTGA